MTIKTALTIAGSDPCGGAGLQADLKTFQALGVYGLSAVTALTVQNTRRVEAIIPLPACEVRAQLRHLWSDISLLALKVGMLAAAEIVEAVAAFLSEKKAPRVVLDPIIDSQSGYALLDDKGVYALKKHLLPLCLIVTPNVPEAVRLSGVPIQTEKDMRAAAEIIHDLGVPYVLIKGGHLEGGDACCDLLYDGERHVTRRWPRLKGISPHGTGCVLSAAITAGLAQGRYAEQAVSNGQDYLHYLLGRAIRPGGGYPLLNDPVISSFHK